MSGCVLVCLSSPLTSSFSPGAGTLSCYLRVLQPKDWFTGKQKVVKATKICTRESYRGYAHLGVLEGLAPVTSVLYFSPLSHSLDTYIDIPGEYFCIYIISVNKFFKLLGFEVAHQVLLSAKPLAIRIVNF